ncbi:MAG: carbon dioxide concentrating mechanism protein CcmL [Planctomycetota bacterium]|nr:carbon dioxide concentrating mechanism protein CcmL [Planctomycetota bacterium]MDA1178614.1 carbon dioxide concentrating mechanism protein CcmL [Planctomycetota bacterium]
MRIAQIIGKVTLSRSHAEVRGLTLRLVHPLSLSDARRGTASPTADLIATVDVLGSGDGDLVLLAEGQEAAQPFYPERKPIDAYNAAILDSLTIDPRWADRA